MTKLSFYLAIIYVSLYYIRPFEWLGPLYGLPILQVLGVVLLIYIVFECITGRLKLFETGTDFMFFGFLFSMLLSQVFTGWLGGVVEVFQKMMPVVVGYLIVRSALDSRDAVRRYVVIFICISAFIGYEGWRQATTGMSHGGMTPVTEGEVIAGQEDITSLISRIRWYGVFNDPNDLAMALVVVVPFLMDLITKRRYLFSAVALPLIITAVYLTNSRGGMLACAAGIASFFIIRYRSKRSAIVAIILAGALLVLGPSRMGGFSNDDESANGRIESWYQGYQMFKEHPIFGVSKGTYTDYNELTAHNSFVLVLAELGIVGSFFFTGMFYFPFKWLALRIKDPLVCTQDGWGEVSAAFGSIIAMMTAMFFLSRSYVMLPYLVFALLLSVVLRYGGKLIEELSPTFRDFKLIFFILLGEIVGINVIVKVLL